MKCYFFAIYVLYQTGHWTLENLLKPMATRIDAESSEPINRNHKLTLFEQDKAVWIRVIVSNEAEWI